MQCTPLSSNAVQFTVNERNDSRPCHISGNAPTRVGRKPRAYGCSNSGSSVVSSNSSSSSPSLARSTTSASSSSDTEIWLTPEILALRTQSERSAKSCIQLSASFERKSNVRCCSEAKRAVLARSGCMMKAVSGGWRTASDRTTPMPLKFNGMPILSFSSNADASRNLPIASAAPSSIWMCLRSDGSQDNARSVRPSEAAQATLQAAERSSVVMTMPSSESCRREGESTHSSSSATRFAVS
mmetsp:Transcript_36640/g.70498  ORF Transcript_36640/g.70498 Transcript_36640/m.70498 type:complete len:241 (-) Transcript_36640:118-840(-)